MFSLAILFSVIRTRGKIINKQETGFSKMFYIPWTKSLNLRALAGFFLPVAQRGFFASWLQGWKSPRLFELWGAQEEPRSPQMNPEFKILLHFFFSRHRDCFTFRRHKCSMNLSWIVKNLFIHRAVPPLETSAAWIQPQRIQFPSWHLPWWTHLEWFKDASVYTIFGSDVTSRVTAHSL